MRIFCRKIIVNNREILKLHGPLLIASNHPNSFLDAVLLDILFDKPIWSLARGDVFKNQLVRKLLHSLRIFPVYRVSEGAGNLNHNYATFEACKHIFRQNGIVSIFSEGKSINEWRLRPLKKGTARLAISCWEENIPLRVLPVGINYSSFRRFGKNVMINFGEIITYAQIPQQVSDGMRNQAFNGILQQELSKLVYEIETNDREKKRQLLEKNRSRQAVLLFAVPAFVGWLAHLPLYVPVRKIAFRKTANNDHYDSVLAAVLLFTYPIYLLLVCLLLFYFTGSYYSASLFLLMPLTAWCYVQVKGQLDK